MRNYSDEEVSQFIEQAPEPIRESIRSAGLARTISAIVKNKGLHIDQMGEVVVLNRNMLLGLVSPPEFLEKLITIGIPHKTARDIMMEINQKIFVPLRKEIRSETETKQEVAKPSMPPPVPPPSLQAILPTLPKQIPSIVWPTMITAPKPIENNNLLEDHEEPSPSLKTTPTLARSDLARPTIPRPPAVLPPQPKLAPITSYTTDPYREPIDGK